MFHVTQDFLINMEEAEKDCWNTYLSGPEKLQGNPLGIYFSSLGRATAFLVKSSFSAFFNKTLGFGTEHIEFLDPLLDFYHFNDKICTIELIPTSEDEEITLALTQKGLYNCNHDVMLFKQLNANKNTIDKNIIIQRIYKEDSELLADIHVTGFEFEGFDAEQEHLIVKEGYNNEKFQCYIAKIDNNPIGAGSLFVHDTIGVLFGGTTVPQYRGKGGQKALLEYRINEAIDLGCEVLISHTTVNSQSQRNLERVGFQIACHRARWTEIPY